MREYLQTPEARQLAMRIEAEYAKHTICPPKDKLFSAFNICPPDNVKVVILGQDPYFNRGQAMGMCFSIDPNCGCDFPPSLRNIITEIKSECGECSVEAGDLTSWAGQGVLLLNTCLTVKLGTPLSHVNIGWDSFTRAAISGISKHGGIVFVLWGSHAGKYRELIADKGAKGKNLVLSCAHPSPLSASRGFFGCGHFLKINEHLKSIGKSPIIW